MKPDIFNKMAPCMLDERVAVCLVPQCFHNLIHPDALDAANGDFMFGRLPFFFGAGVLFVTGTSCYAQRHHACPMCTCGVSPGACMVFQTRCGEGGSALS